jgi:hypothetical protein
METYRQRPKQNPVMVEILHIVRLEEECHNFLYEAKNFVRDFLKAFNILYGATFAEVSNYFRRATPKKRKTIAHLVRRNDVRATNSGNSGQNRLSVWVPVAKSKSKPQMARNIINI